MLNVYVIKPGHLTHLALRPHLMLTPQPTTSSTLYTESDHTVLLQTAQATIYNSCRPHISDKIRVVLDCGSQQSYITDVVKRKLSLRPEGRRDTVILTFGSRMERVHSCDIVKVGVCTKKWGSHGAKTVVSPVHL